MEIKELISISEELGFSDISISLQNIFYRMGQKDCPIILPLIGEFSAGKTSLINSLTDSKQLETATKPTTATIYEIHFGSDSAYAEVKKAAKRVKLTDEDLYKMYQAGDKNLVFSIQNKIAVKDTLFKNRPDFNIDTIEKIPFAVGEYGAAEVQDVEMDAIVKKVSGVDVPLFEAKMPYKSLLNGLDHQLVVNLVAEREDLGQYEGLQVGSVTAPNNNAGNWE